MTERDAVWTAVARKRAIRRFAGRPLEADHLRRILDAGRHAGSSKNSQPWAFIVVEDRETLRELGKVGPYAGHLAGAAAGIALVSLVFVGPKSMWDWLGLLPIATGLLGSCPAYTLFGISTCPVKSRG